MTIDKNEKKRSAAKSHSTRITIGIGLTTMVLLVVWQLVLRKSPEIASGEKPKDAAPILEPVAITMDYPLEGSIFPPEFPSPTWMWRDPDDKVTSWEISIQFPDGASPIRIKSAGEPLRIGDIDSRAVSSTNKPPTLTPKQAAAHTWIPDADVWAAIKKHSVEQPIKVVFTGYRERDLKNVASKGEVTISTSRDPVGAPVFYRDVPLMPSENEKGVIKPLAKDAVPLIAWRLRNIGDTKSRVLMDDLHTCANCHSFSTDGKTMGMDMDGPRNNKGLYGIVDVKSEMTIREEDLITWSTFRGKLGSKLRVGFMSQISPDGQYVMTTVNDPGVDQTDAERRENPIDLTSNYYVANFKDYRFLQVFYPTRGVLAWYNREGEHLTYLPGADDSNYVHANATWSPGGKYLVFARAKAMDAYPEGASAPKSANDSNELQIKYDLYRIPFNGGKGGTPEAIEGASQNGMSNSFPKISPDGKWLVYVQAKNGLLMRPDSKLYIVPTKGGKARLMNCNTELMNSWHSFSPNGRWLVFSSKSRSPYTQMFLTHIDEAGNDSPAILIENSTAANRAINIPEFVNVSNDGIKKINTPVADYARYVDRAVDFMKEKKFAEAISELENALKTVPKDWWAHNALGEALLELGRFGTAMVHFREAIALNPEYAQAFNNVGKVLMSEGAVPEAIEQFEKAIAVDSESAEAYGSLGIIYARLKQPDKAIGYLKKAVAIIPDNADARRRLGHALGDSGKLKEASTQLEEAVRLSGEKDAMSLYLLGDVYEKQGETKNAIKVQKQALSLAKQGDDPRLIKAVNARLEKLSQ
jgi:tetratricopeptide (TPR) repeat protein